MAGFRVPGPQGAQAVAWAIDSGTAARTAMPPPGPVGVGATGRGAAAGGHPAAGLRPVAPAASGQGAVRVPVLRLGSQGDEVRKLQRLLNLRLGAGLAEDGRFGASTLAAVQQAQRAGGVTADGVAGKDTWRVLVANALRPGAARVATVAQGGRAGVGAAPSALAGAVAAVAGGAAPAARPAAAPSANDVLAWTTAHKYDELVRRTLDRLPGKMKAELVALVSPAAIALTLGLWAASHLVGAGELLDVGLFIGAMAMVGWAVFDVAHDLGRALVLTHNAGSPQELDEAAGLLAHVIAVIGVTALVALLAKIKLGKGSGGAAQAAKAEAGAAPRKTGTAAAAEESAAANKPANSTSNKPADKVGSLCEKNGCPISMVTGEEMLALDDFVWDGPLPLAWRRFYRSGLAGRDGQLGHGWLTPLDDWLEVQGERMRWTNADGQHIELPLPGPGQTTLNLPEQVRLTHRPDGWLLHTPGGPDRVYALQPGPGGVCALLRWQSPAGAAITLVRDEEAGQVQALVASGGRRLELLREGGRIVAIRPGRPDGDVPADPLVRYTYSADGDLVAVHDRLDHGERYQYRQHLLMQRTLASGFNFHFEWQPVADGPARCVRNWGDAGIYDYRFEWLAGGVSRAIDSRGGVTEYQHNGHGQLLRKRTPEGHETRCAYNLNNQLRAVTDAAGHVTRYAYDAQGRLTSVTDALGQVQQLAHDDAGRPVAYTDATGARWRRRFDRDGRLLEQRDPTGATTHYRYNAQGLLAQVLDAAGRQRTLLWDAQQRLVGETGFDGVRRRYQLDADDRIVAVTTQDRLTTRYERDATGRVVAVHQPDGRSVRLRYNAAGQLVEHVDAGGQRTVYTYEDGLSQPGSRTDALGRTTRYQYDSERNLVGLVNPLGDAYQLSYDLDERLVHETGFDGRQQHYRYDATGALVQHLEALVPDAAVADEAAWRINRFERDALGRLQRKTTADGQSAEFSHDAAGRLTSARNAHSSVDWTYDAVGRVLREAQNGRAVDSLYDPLGRRTRLGTPDGLPVLFRHDAQGRLVAVLLDGLPVSGHRYDELGREVARQQGALDSVFAHDPMGRLLRHQASRSSSSSAAVVLGRHYGYDEAGRLAQVDDLRHGRAHYQYDPADQLLAVQGLAPEHFVHDPAGNLLGASADDGRVQGNRLLMQGDRHYTHDASGNVVQLRRGKAGALRTTYHYDAENRLVQADTPQGPVSFLYDALGRRIAKRSALGETRFVYDGLTLLEERHWPPGVAPEAATADGADGPSTDTASGRGEAGAVAPQQRLYLFEPGSFRPLAVVDGDGPAAGRRISYYQLDQLGTPRELTDAQGRVVWSGRLRAHGALALADEQTVPNPLRFQGQYHDVETGLHYNLNRYYDPECGRFIHQDPIGLAGGDNLYRYAPNPVNWVDPLGLTSKDCPPRPYAGVKEASAYLQEMGVPRNQRVQILQSFDVETIQLRNAGSSEYGMRYFDGLTAQPKGRYLFETFPASRESLALAPEWNRMTGMTQWQISPGTTIIEGRAAAQGAGLPGGQIQKFVLNLGDLIAP